VSDSSNGHRADDASPDKRPLLTQRWRALGGDLKDPRWIYLKGCLFLLCGVLAGGLLLMEHPTWKGAMLLALTVWCFCRGYYFAFYVIEHYVDSEYKFAGLWSFVRYLFSRRA
jgi:hypothetical protein